METPVHAFLLIQDYFKLDGFVDIIVDNFEFSHTYPAAVLSVDHILRGSIDLQAGLTIIKSVFIFIPREIWEYKPDSFISIFTNAQAPNVFKVGGSFPVAMPSELFANFHSFSLLILYVLLKVFNKLHRNCINSYSYCINFQSSIGLVVLFFMAIRGLVSIYFF